VRNCCLAFFLTVLAAAAQTAGSRNTFTDPLLPSGPDPWVIYKDGFYYEMNTTARNLRIRKTRDITQLRDAESKIVWTPPESGPYSHDIWAPELHFLQGKWYIYFAADAGTNETHRLYVVENESPDPLSGTWTFKGQLKDPSNRWAIDGTVFEQAGQLYAVWSGWEGAKNGMQSLYIARLRNPWTIEGKRSLLSSPKYPWETIGSQRDPFVAVNEGPEILKHDDQVFLVYSASGCWTDNYTLGMLTAKAGSNLTKRKSWKKHPTPLFSTSPAAHAYGPGHNGFFLSPDGSQNWIIYHANPEPGQGCRNNRSPRIQQFTWNSDGTPNFGTPVPIGEPLPKPSGTQ
jgi:GH43 family beta-xylosidase